MKDVHEYPTRWQDFGSTRKLNTMLIMILSVLWMSCGILDGDTKKDEPPKENELHMLINGKPWQEYHNGDLLKNSKPETFIFMRPDGAKNVLELNIGWSLEYESTFSEHFMIKFVFPEEYNISELVIPYSQSFSEKTFPNSMYFNEWEYDGLISIFERSDKFHEPIATITYLSLDKGIIEVEFEGTIIVPVEYDPPQYARWYGIDTLRITEGRIRSVELKDRRAQ